MIVPIRCFTCNNLIASKYKKYIEYIKRNRREGYINLISNEVVMDINHISIENEAFKAIGIKRYCCKRCLLTHVNLIQMI